MGERVKRTTPSPGTVTSDVGASWAGGSTRPIVACDSTSRPGGLLPTSCSVLSPFRSISLLYRPRLGEGGAPPGRTGLPHFPRPARPPGQPGWNPAAGTPPSAARPPPSARPAGAGVPSVPGWGMRGTGRVRTRWGGGWRAGTATSSFRPGGGKLVGGGRWRLLLHSAPRQPDAVSSASPPARAFP